MHDRLEILGGLLIGGKSRRMGRPKHLLEVAGVLLMDHVAAALRPHVQQIVLLGSAEVPAEWDSAPRLADPEGVEGPMAGILAAMRWAPRATWIVAACDLPRVDRHAVAWLIEQRRPEYWAVLPHLSEHGLEPVLAIYEPQSAPLLEEVLAGGLLAPRHIASHPAVHCPRPPDDLVGAWTNVNTPEDLQSLQGERSR